MSHTKIATTTCPAWCRADHAADALRYPLQDGPVHRQVLARLDDDAFMVDLALDDEDDAPRLYIWLGGESLSVEAGTPEQRAALADLFRSAAAALAGVDR